MSLDGRNNNEKDDFWDIDKLVPKKKASLTGFATKPMTSEYTAAPPTSASQSERAPEERKLSLDTMRGYNETEDVTYKPENSLIKSITVKKYKNNYDFYDSFRKAAILYFDCPGSSCPFAQFYSYMPQYSQLTRTQRDYYFFWRSEMRQGRYIKTDYSYLYLYVYEIINLPDLIPPEKGIRLLCAVWREYRRDLPRIDSYFSIWVRDYCLIHALPCPTDELRSFLSDVIRISSMKEFYFTDIGIDGRAAVWPLVAYLSDYDWQRGLSAVFAKIQDPDEKNRKIELYTGLFEGCVRLLLPNIWTECLGERSDERLVKVTENAFPNTLCTHSVKSKIEIEYYPLAASESLKSTVTSIVRYIENKLRAVFGIKSRLAVRSISREYTELIDCFFADILKRAELDARRRNAPAYERQYDAPAVKLSTEGADEIERMSWDITARLCEEGDGDDISDTPDLSIAEDTESEETEKNVYIKEADEPLDSYGLSDDEIDFVRALAEGNTPSVAGFDGENMMDRINEAFSDGFGDVIIEYDGSEFTLIEDYREEITEWISKITK